MPSQYGSPSANFTYYFSSTLPTITALKTLCFFGSGGDGINTNRAPGGPALSTIGPAPTYGTNYVTLGQITGAVSAAATATLSGNTVASIAVNTPGTLYSATPTVLIIGGGGTGATAHAVRSGATVGSVVVDTAGSGYTVAPTVVFIGGNTTALDTNNPRTSGVVTSGWTWMLVAAAPTTGAPSTLICDAGTSASTTTSFGLTLQTSSETINTFQNATIQTPMAITASAPLSGYHCVSFVYSGGNSSPITTYDLTDGITGTAGAGPAANLTDAYTPRIGFDGTLRGPGPTRGLSVAVAFAMVAFSPLNLSAQQAIYASVQSILGRRGIVC